MNRVVSRYASFALFAILATIVIGCASIIPMSVKIQNADRALEKANGFRIQANEPEARAKELAQQKALYDAALKAYLTVVEANPTGKYAQRAHFGSAQIYRKRGEWDKATEHYQAIVELAPFGYYASESKSNIANIRKNRELIQNERRNYQNYKALYEQTKESEPKKAAASYDTAAEALYSVAKAYETLDNFSEAIRNYEKVADEFPEHRLAPQAQSNAGRVYFYKLFDYSNAGGWGAYIKLRDNFPDSFEADQAGTTLIKTAEILKQIRFDQEHIRKYTSTMAIKFLGTGRELLPSEIYVMGYEGQMVQDFQQIGRNWEKLENYPYAIVAYRKLAETLYTRKFATANALYQIGRLYQEGGEYQLAIQAYDYFFETTPESTYRDEAVYQQAICYRAIREFSQALRGFKGYMSLGKESDFYREAEQIARQMEFDQDGDGHKLYKEQEAGTSDQDPNDYPGAKKNEAE